MRPIICLQQEPSECGLVAVQAAGAVLGYPISLEALKCEGFYSSRGLKPSDVCETIRACGLEPAPLLLDTTAHHVAIEPATILLLRRGHYVVVGRSRRDAVDVFDPLDGWKWVRRQDLFRDATGIAIAVRGPEARRPLSHAPSGTEHVTAWLWARRQSAIKLAKPAALALLAAVVALAIPLLTKMAIDAATEGRAHNEILFGAAMMAAAGVMGVIMNTIGSVIASTSMRMIDAELSTDLLHRLFQRPLTFFARQSATSIVSRLAGLKSINNIVLSTLTETSVRLLLGLGAIAVSLTVAPALVGVVVAVGLAELLVDLAWKRRRERIFDRLVASEMQWNAAIHEAVGTIKPVRLSGTEHLAISRLVRSHSTKSQTTHDHRVTDAMAAGSHAIATAIGSALVLLLGAMMIQNGQMSPGGFIAVGAYVGLIQGAIAAIKGCVQISIDLRNASSRIAELISDTGADRPALASAPRNDNLEIQLQNVTFRYNRFSDPVFANLSLDILKGEHVAIVAPSGTGKTTLAKLLVGAIAPSEGQVLTSYSASGHPRNQNRRRLATVLQDDHLISGSIADNIALFRGYAQHEIVAAAEAAGIHDFVDGLPMGYKTIVSDQFEGLSGGQRQRLLLARALISTPNVLILDEATSALDAATEREILANLKRLKITHVTFTHRHESIRAADRVLDLRSLARAQGDLQHTPLRNPASGIRFNELETEAL